MENKFRIEKNSYCNKQITIFVDQLHAGVQSALDNCCDGIYLRNSEDNIEFDLECLCVPELKTQIKHISFEGNLQITSKNNLNSLCFFNKLISLFLPAKHTVISLSEFYLLQVLTIMDIGSVMNIELLPSIKTLYLRNKIGKDLSVISAMTTIKYLIVSLSNIENLNGIEALEHLKKIELSYNKKLSDINAINNSSVEYIKIINCKNIYFLDVLSNNNTLKDIYIDKLDNLDFIKSMKLQSIGFENLRTGDMNPIKNSSLKEVRFYPFKRHYSHSEKEINELIK